MKGDGAGAGEPAMLSRMIKGQRRNFFIWIRHNPLKSPESAKGIQGNPSSFPWFYLF
jgi:hypothetical protein